MSVTNVDGAVQNPDPGKKLDAGKPPLMAGCLAYFPRALNAVADVSAYGAKKYSVSFADKNWERVPDAVARYTDALSRHLVAEAVEGGIDSESRLMHAAHLAWNALARLELMIKRSVIEASMQQKMIADQQQARPAHAFGQGQAATGWHNHRAWSPLAELGGV